MASENAWFERLPSFRTAIVVFGATCVLAAFDIPKHTGSAAPVITSLIELALVLSGGVAALRASFGGADADAVSERIVRFVGTLFLLITVGQLINRKQSYPFVPFHMYGAAHEETAEFYVYEATLASGRKERFRPSTVISTLGSGRIVRGLGKRFDSQARGKASSGPDEERDLAFDTLRVLVRLHNSKHPKDPVERVGVYRVSLPAPYLPKTARRVLVGVVSTES